MSAGIFSASFKYYWLAIGIFALFALTIWYCKCHGQNRQRQQEASERRQMLIRQLSRGRAAISVPAPERPSRYRSNAPPAYDDVINKPQDYPVYHADAQVASTSVALSPAGSDEAEQNLPSYEEVIEMSANLTAQTPPNVPEEREEININDMQQ